jgi:hypothetical protein
MACCQEVMAPIGSLASTARSMRAIRLAIVSWYWILALDDPALVAAQPEPLGVVEGVGGGQAARRVVVDDGIDVGFEVEPRDQVVEVEGVDGDHHLVP